MYNCVHSQGANRIYNSYSTDDQRFIGLFTAIDPWHCAITIIYKDLKNIKNVKECRDGMPKSMQTR